jgi:hypothetical protein
MPGEQPAPAAERRGASMTAAPFDDPAHAKGTEEEILNEFRRVRDEIKTKFTAYGVEVKAGKLK